MKGQGKMTTNTHLIRSALPVLVVLLSVWPGPLQLIPLACGQDPEPNSITDGLVGYWAFEDGAGYFASDRSGHGNHGILSSPSIPLWQPTGGRVNGALLFDGNGGYVTCGNSQDFDLVKGLTVTAWIRVNAFNKDWQAIVTKGDSAWRLHRYSNTNFIDFACNGLVGGNMEWGSTVWGSTSVNDGQWHHVAGVYDYPASRVYLYVDGYLDGPNSVRVGSGGIATNTFDVYIGENAERRGRLWNGLIDDVRIYPVPLTASQILSLANLKPPAVSMVAHWKLDESGGTTANDSSGNSHPGTLQMGTSPTWEAGKIDGSLFFHGSPDHVNCGNNPIFNITDHLTIAAWVNITGPPADWTGIVTKGDDAWRLSTVSNQRIFHFAVTGAPNYWSINGTTEAGLEEWHHVCGTYDGNFIRLYVDGVEEPASPIAYTGSVSVSPHDVWLSGNSDRQGREFMGLLDELAVWNRALYPYEVEWLFNDGLGNPVWQPTGLYVDDNAPGDPGPGNPDISDPLEDGSQEHPFDAIQEAIDVAVDWNTVVVLDGTYTGTGNHDIDFWGMAITVCSRNGPVNCIVDCQGGEQLCRGFIFQNGEGADSILDGFTIINGYETYENVGGGILCYSSSPTINNCIIRNNMGDMGGGIYCENNSNLTISNCTISNNITSWWGAGGGIYCGWNSGPTIIDCTINNNISDGLWIYSYAFVEGTTSFASNNLTGNGTLMIEPNAILDVRDCNVSFNVIGNGTILVPHGKHITFENNAIINLGDPNDPTKNGTFQCNGLLRVKDNAQVTRTNLNVARASFEDTCLISNNIITTSAIAPCGQIMVKDTASITSNDIYANGDRYLDLNPSTFAGTITDNRIFVTITEGTNKTLPALFELRGVPDLAGGVSCDPNNPFFCQAKNIPGFGLNSWTIETLELVEGAKLTLTNRIDFQPPYDEGGEYEVLYVKHLILGPNSVLDTAYNRLYYGTLERHSTAKVKNTSLQGFSLGKIDFDDEQKFATCIVHNNFIDIDPAPPDTTRIHVERIEGLSPDRTGMMWMRNLRDIDPESPTYGKIISTRAKALFAKCTEEKITIRFEYLFNTFEPGAELVVYLSDVPDLLAYDDPMRDYHYIEVARIPAPPPGRPGSAGSGRFAVFEKTVFTEELNLREGTCIEVELIEPESQGIRLFSLGCAGLRPSESIDTGLESSPPPGASAFLDSWSAEVHCPGICLDLSGDTVVNEVDFVTVICACGSASELLPDGSGDFVCFEGPFGSDGYIDSSDMSGWDWVLCSDGRKNLCDGIPLSEGMETTSIEADNLADFGSQPMLLANPSDLNDLLILGKKGTKSASNKRKDRLYVFDSTAQYIKYLSAASENCTARIVQDPNGQIYQINYEAGVRKLDPPSHTVIIPPGQPTYAGEPRYNKSATVYVGIKGEGEDAVGRPILDAAFDANGYIYVVPVVVNPDGNEPYAAAAKLQVISGSPPYKVVKIYDDPPPPSDNQYRNNLREIEIDSAGNIYVFNAHALNESDILWRYYTNGTKERVDLADPDINLPDPIAMYMSNGTDMLYIGSAQYNPDDSNDSIILGFSTKTSLTLTRTITIQDMHHVTGITEDPDSGSLWVVGFNMDDIPEYPDPYQAPFYYPVLAKVPLGTNNVQAQTLSGLHDLAMPLSILWTKTTNCGGADLNGSNRVNFDDFALLSRRWRNTNCAPPSWCYGADLNKSKTVELRDLAILAENWLQTDCQN